MTKPSIVFAGYAIGSKLAVIVDAPVRISNQSTVVNLHFSFRDARKFFWMPNASEET